MHAYGTDRIIHVELQIKDFDYNDYQDTGYDTDDCRADGVQRVTACGDADQARQRSVQAHRYIGLAVLDPGVQQSGAGGDCRSDRRGDEDGSKGVAVPGSSAVETVPAEPQDEASEST